MKNYFFACLFFTLLMTTPVFADVISNPLIWLLYDPLFLILLIIGVCLLSILLRKIFTRKENHK